MVAQARHLSWGRATTRATPQPPHSRLSHSPRGSRPTYRAANHPGDSRAIAIAEAARRLVQLRGRWLNPPEWVDWAHDPAPDYPLRPVPRDDAAATAVKRRTLTNLYNSRPRWLVDAHATLDGAVAAAYGWSADISVDDALRELMTLNMRDVL